MEEAVAVTIELESYLGNTRPTPVAAVSSPTTSEDSEPVAVVSSDGADIRKLTERLARMETLLEDTLGRKSDVSRANPRRKRQVTCWNCGQCERASSTQYYSLRRRRRYPRRTP